MVTLLNLYLFNAGCGYPGPSREDQALRYGGGFIGGTDQWDGTWSLMGWSMVPAAAKPLGVYSDLDKPMNSTLSFFRGRKGEEKKNKCLT